MIMVAMAHGMPTGMPGQWQAPPVGLPGWENPPSVVWCETLVQELQGYSTSHHSHMGTFLLAS